MIDLLFWTSGRGTGHVKRANALRRGFDLAGAEVRLWVAAEASVFPHLLDRRLRPWPGPAQRVDACVLDHRLDTFPAGLAGIAPLFVRPCRIGTDPRVPPPLAGRVAAVAIEDCRDNRALGLAYEGCLVDAAEEEVLGREAAREALARLAGRDLAGRLGLTHANTAEPEAALGFLLAAAERLAGAVDTVIVSTGHAAIAGDLERRLASRFGGRAVAIGHDPIFRLYRAFAAGHFPSGYNTYCETRLFFRGTCTWEPVACADRRPRFRDQHLRARELPEVGGIGNERIARRILALAAARG